MFNIDWYGMLKIEYSNGWMSYDNLKLFVGFNDLTKEQFAEITGKDYDSGEVIQPAATSASQQ